MAFSGSILPLRSCVVASSLPSIGGGEVPDLASTERGAVSTSKTVKREAKSVGQFVWVIVKGLELHNRESKSVSEPNRSAGSEALAD